jgi:hypothetical protein
MWFKAKSSSHTLEVKLVVMMIQLQASEQEGKKGEILIVRHIFIITDYYRHH